MKTRKTKKGNSIRRIVAFLLCMTMVLGLGMQDVMEQVYAEEGPATVQQDVQGTENNENGEQDSASEDPNETPSPTEEGDKAPENTPAPESETGSETPSDSSTPGQPADGQGTENGTGNGNTGNTGNAGSDENSGNTGNTGNAGSTEQNNSQNTGNTSDGTQGSENGNTGSGNEDKTPAADGAENSDGTKDPNGDGAPAADGVQGVKPTVPGEEDVTGNETADPTEETDETKVPEEEIPEEEKAYEAEQKVDNVTIHVSADAGVLPVDAELSVTPIVKTEITDDMSEEDRAEAEKINAQYDETEQKLTEELAEESAVESSDAAVMTADTANDVAAEDSSTEGGMTLEGFLAYDISFLVTDEEGNESEIEPEGEVNVTFEFDEAVIPEGVSENAEVSVAHLKEDASVGDGIVVENLTDAEMATVETTANAEVTKVELVTESFSSFVIYWGKYHEWNRVTIYYVDTSGKGINGQQTGEIGFENGKNVAFTDEVYGDDVPGYEYKGAHLNSYNGTKIYSVKYSYSDDNHWTYKEEQGGGDQNWNRSYYNEREVFLVYEKDDIQVHFVSGADGRDLMEPMNLADFFEKYESGETADLAPDIEGYRFVKTMIASSYDQYEDTYYDDDYWALRLRENRGEYQYNRARFDGASDNQWIEINNQVYFIYKPDDYQISTHDSNSDGITLNLFNYDKNIKDDAENAGFPFYNGKINHVDGQTGSESTGGEVKNTLDNDEYPVSSNGKSLDFLFGKNPMSANYLFTYDENTYSYEYDSQKNHALYDEDDKRFYVYDYTLSPADTRDSSYADFEVGNFFPFNDTIDPKQGKLNYIQYGREQRTNVDYWFGMSMSMNFYQPEDGRLPNGDAMEFEFRGDDDVFVYLDGVLILDLGGIHAAQSGSINFATGTIEQNGDTIFDGIYQKYVASGLFTNAKLNDIFTEIQVNGRTCHIFSDYYDAKMDFFYLERGAGASNCHIKFNMPPIPQDTIIVGKQITDANASVYSDVEFSFALEIEKENVWKTVESGDVKIYDAVGNYIETRQIENGVFKLKHGERAYFDYPANTKYRVTETDVSSQEYDKVTITGVYVTKVGSGGETEQIFGWQTEDLVVSETPMVIFRNSIATENEKTLSIHKEVLNIEDDESYGIQVFFGDEAGKEDGSPYTGEYWIDGVRRFAENGIIVLQDNQKASIVKIPSGTSFKVVEIGLSDEYIKPVYAIDHADEVSIGDAALGKLVLDHHTTVTITNAKKDTPDTAYIQVRKTFEGLTKEDVEKLKLEGSFAISLYTNPSCEGEPEIVVSLSNGTADDTGLVYTWQVEIPEENVYYVKESGQEVQNYKIKAVTVNETEVSDGGSVEVDLSQISTSYTLNVEKISALQLNNSVTEQPDIIAGKFSDEDKFLVWTENALSASERIGILEALKSDQTSDFANASIENTVFFSTNKKLQGGIAYQGIVSYYIRDGKPTINLHSPEKWDAVVYGTYTENSESRDAEIDVVNEYETKEISIDLKKYGTDFDEENLRDGAVFRLYKGEIGADHSLTWFGNALEGYGNIEVQNDDTVELKLGAGYYKLVEDTAPTGYQKLNEAIYFKLDITADRPQITWIDENGYKLSPAPTMWQLDEAAETITIQIKNDALYDLPEAGGPGIHLYMLGGTMLMMAGALLVYKKRKEEVLRS